jgi:hypothetical protein
LPLHLGKVLPQVAEYLVEKCGKMSTDGKTDALAWVLAALTAVPLPAEDGAAGRVKSIMPSTPNPKP